MRGRHTGRTVGYLHSNLERMTSIKAGLDADLQTACIFNFGFAFKSNYIINFMVINDIMHQLVT